MAVKIRLARRGRKKMAMYDIVIAESTSPRDGRFIEKIGTYNPNTDPSTVALKADRAVYWLMVGAQPTDTARSVLSHEGIMYRKHLQVGVNKGAITQEQADANYSTWQEGKQSRKAGAADMKSQTKEQARAARLDAEKKVSETRADAIVKKNKVEEPVAAETAIADALPVADVEEAHAADSLGEVPVELTAAVAVPTEAAPVDETLINETPIADIVPADEVAEVEAIAAPAEEAAPAAKTEAAPEAEPTPAPAEAPVAEKPVTDEKPAEEVAPANMDTPTAETPAVDETDAVAEETPVAELPAAEETPAELPTLASEEAPATEAPVADAAEETPAAEPAADDEKPAAK